MNIRTKEEDDNGHWVGLDLMGCSNVVERGSQATREAGHSPKLSRICKGSRNGMEIKERGRKIVETFGRDLEIIFKQHSELLVLSQNQFKIFGNMKGLVFIQNKTRWGRFNKTIRAKNNRV
jgi:hypothetical protein